MEHSQGEWTGRIELDFGGHGEHVEIELRKDGRDTPLRHPKPTYTSFVILVTLREMRLLPEQS